MKLEDLHRIPSEGKLEYFSTECGRIFKKMPNPPKRQQLRNYHKEIEGQWFRELFGSTDGGGYLKVQLNGKLWRFHRAIIAAFRGTSELHVDHINAIKTDNRLENLEYVTNAENLRRAGIMGINIHRPETHKEMRRLLQETYLSPREIASELGLHKTAVYYFVHKENLKRPSDYSGNHKNHRKPTTEVTSEKP